MTSLLAIYHIYHLVDLTNVIWRSDDKDAAISRLNDNRIHLSHTMEVCIASV